MTNRILLMCKNNIPITYPKINEIHRPLVQGELILVPCFVKEDGIVHYITPVYDCPHSDKDSGQDYVHYHADYRFIPHDTHPIGNRIVAIPINDERRRDFDTIVYLGHSVNRFNDRPTLDGGENLVWRLLPVVDPNGFYNPTKESLISKENIKPKICKGKCPHKGFDLSQVEAIDGVITCPLHGLRFDNKTKKLIV